MGRIFGFLVGIVWLVFASVAFRNSSAGWGADATDLGFWWAVIGVFLTLAAGGALVGTWLHTRPQHGVVHPVDRAEH
jgi:hypothetical protein